MSESTQAAPLKRVVGVAALGLNIVNLTVAAGIFGLPAIIAALLGPQAILAYLVCALLFGLVGLCMAESGSRVGSAGGLYAYASVPFGPVVGGVAGTLLWFASGAVADAAIASLLVDTLAVVSPWFATPWVRTATLLAVFATVMAINIRGVTHGLRLSVTLTVIKIAPLALLVIGGLLYIDPAKLAWTSMPPLRSVGEASVVLFYAFFGFEAALSMSSEIVRPSRTVPWGIFLGLLIIATLYIGLQVVAQGTMGAALASPRRRSWMSPGSCSGTGAVASWCSRSSFRRPDALRATCCRRRGSCTPSRSRANCRARSPRCIRATAPRPRRSPCTA